MFGPNDVPSKTKGYILWSYSIVRRAIGKRNHVGVHSAVKFGTKNSGIKWVLFVSYHKYPSYNS